MQLGNSAKWWFGLIGVALFLITVAPDYQLQHVALGGLIVIGIHFLAALFKLGQAAKGEAATNSSSSKPPVPSNTATLILLLPLALIGVIGLLVGGTSVWHAYFCALAIGAFTAMYWLFPSRPNKKEDVASGGP